MNELILERDLELLSSYLDDQLSPSEQELVEKRLESDSIYDEAFEKLRRTCLILRSLPQRSAPRNFTLSSEVNKKKVNIPSFFQIFRFSSAVAVLGLVILLVFDFLPSYKQSVLIQKLEVAQVPAAATPAAKANELPMIIIWGTSQPEVLGKGGGGGGGNAQTGTITSYAIPQPATELSTLPSEKVIPPDQTLSPQVESTLVAPPEDTLAAPQIKESESAISGTGPILGIPPSNERGSVLSTLSVQPPTASTEKMDALRISELVVGVLALLTGIIAFLLHKKQVS
jgi:hypothetical protein